MPELGASPSPASTVLAIFAGGAIALRLAHTLPTVIALSGGIVVAVALLDVLPEAIESVGDAQRRAAALVALGFLAFFLIERVAGAAPPRRPRGGPRPTARSARFGALGLSLHTFTDGLGIGLAFSVDVETGLLVLLAVVSHGFADGLNTVSFVLSQSGDRAQRAAMAADRRASRPLAGRDRRLA